jgi:hypothetical protein
LIIADISGLSEQKGQTMNAVSLDKTICTVVAFTLAGCATMPGGQHQQSALDRSINQCVVAVGIGALLGALAANKSNRGTGAVVGAGVGAVACGVLTAINNERDKQKISDAQFRALNAGVPQAEQFIGQDGQTKVVRTSVREVATPPAPAMAAAQTSAASSDRFVGPCRNAQTAITAQGQTAQLPADLYCRTASGDWKLFGA